MNRLAAVALGLSMPFTYAVVGPSAFNADMKRVRRDGVERHGPLSLPQHAGVLGAQALEMGIVIGAAVWRNGPMPARIVIGGIGYAALTGAAALAGIAESRNRLYG
ncbi:MAG: hypothetical protein H7287_12065 [Thermoleophilia bacterium]|nr:hypothetical protein [Thermoleophilia bacterium]